MANFPVPTNQPAPVSPLVPLNSPMVGFASPFGHADGQNRDLILEAIRTWASVNLVTWSAAWQAFFLQWISDVGNYVSANANLVPTDVALAGFIANASATQLAGDLRYARARAAILEVNERFANYPDGPLVKTSTGLTYYPSSLNNVLANVPRIENGTLTYAVNGVAGGYATVQLSDAVTRYGASFYFDAATANTGVATIAVMESEIGASLAGGFGVPRSPGHLQINPTSWSFQVFRTTGGAPVNLGGANFATPLTADGATLYSAEVVLDKIQGTAYITLPDGTAVTISDPAITLAARYVFWEPYRGTTAENRAHFVESWASSHSPAELMNLKRAIHAQTGSRWFAESTLNGTDLVITGTAVDIPGAVVTYIAPVSNKILVTLSAQINSTAAGDVFFVVKYPGAGQGTIAYRAVNGTGHHTLTMPITLTAPAGYPYQISFGIQQGSGTNTLKLAGNYNATIEVAHYQS